MPAAANVSKSHDSSLVNISHALNLTVIEDVDG